MSAAASPLTFQPTAAIAGSPLVHGFYHQDTSTWTFLVVDPETKHSVLIDPVLDYNPASGSITTESVQSLVAFTKENQLTIDRIIETHVHADHLTGAYAMKMALEQDVPVYIGEKVSQVLKSFASTYDLESLELNHSFDGYLHNNDRFDIGNLEARCISLPGHTPDGMGILIGDCLFAGDSIFMPDVGTARVDFPGGDAGELYTSIKQILELPGDIRIFSGHDYPTSRGVECMSTVREQVERNKHVGATSSLDDFIKFRTARDAQLGSPRLLHASLQVNLRAGRLPPPDTLGRTFMKTPVRDSGGVGVGVNGSGHNPYMLAKRFQSVWRLARSALLSRA